MKILRYKKDNQKYIELRILNTYDITKSSQEIVYSDLTCDFTGYNVDDLPEKYQEVQLIERNSGYDEIKYFGYIDSYNFNEMREIDKFMEINITLLSPMKIATLRTFVAVGTYQLKNLLNLILTPLIHDGFAIEEMDITNRSLTVNYLAETIEYGLNDLSNKYNFWWFIDENKKIYIKDIDKMLSSDPKYIYDDTHKLNGLEYLKPTIISDNYANVINFKNVRIYENSSWEYSDGQVVENINGLINEQISTLKKDGQIDFKFPVDIKKENIKKAGQSYKKINNYFAIRVFGTYTDNTTFGFYIRYNVENDNYVISSNIGFDGDENTTGKDFLLIRDAMFNNLIIGFKYNNENKNIAKIDSIKSDSILVWNVNKFYNDKAINEKKGIINNTGIVELTINMNEQWKTRQELQEIGISYMNKNSLKLDGEIQLKLDNNLFKIGDILKINKMLFNSKYIITQIRENFHNGVIEYFITCKNSNITDNYIDLFRSATSQQNDEKIYQINISHYNEEGIKETFEVVK
jgi:hypothetical protein